MGAWPQYVPWLSGPLGYLLGPLLGLAVWWAEGSSSSRKPRLTVGSADDLAWDSNYPLNRLLLAILFGSGFTLMLVALHAGDIRGPIDIGGAFLCGFLTWPIGFLAVAHRHLGVRYREFQRFSYLRYGYNASST
jgi:hypothetical protein